MLRPLLSVVEDTILLVAPAVRPRFIISHLPWLVYYRLALC
jgi:hypothetical protein